ncbi:GNAT family N-acetyltransferase [Halobaculum sp. EA56]|uniref:GNAT family N-acetyltransferase n=1 Tax=Halobaculum sp. EA56 TaxID=3421648 RepID=UPI003EB70487
MPGPVFRRGETVELRTVEEEDAAFLASVVNDPRVRAGTSMADPNSVDDEREWIDAMGDTDEAHFLVCVDAEPVGIVGVNAPNETWGTAELGYMLDPDDWGNGYATDAAREACGYAFETRRLHKVYAKVFETNPASARVLEKVGFREEGTLRGEAFVDGEHVDVTRFGLLADEWFAER